MYHVRKISSFDLPELQPYRTMRRPMEHREQGIFVAEGEKVVRRLLESKFIVVSVLLPEKWVGELEPLLRGSPRLRCGEEFAGKVDWFFHVSGTAGGGADPFAAIA